LVDWGFVSELQTQRETRGEYPSFDAVGDGKPVKFAVEKEGCS